MDLRGGGLWHDHEWVAALDETCLCHGRERSLAQGRQLGARLRLGASKTLDLCLRFVDCLVEEGARMLVHAQGAYLTVALFPNG